MQLHLTITNMLIVVLKTKQTAALIKVNIYKVSVLATVRGAINHEMVEKEPVLPNFTKTNYGKNRHFLINLPHESSFSVI